MTDEIRDAFAALFDETFMQQLARGMRANPTTSTARCHVQVDCQQLAGDNCDVTGLAEYMIEVLSSAMSYPTGNRPGGRTAGYRLRLRWGADCGVHLRSAPRDARTLRKTARLFPGILPKFVQAFNRSLLILWEDFWLAFEEAWAFHKPLTSDAVHCLTQRRFPLRTQWLCAMAVPSPTTGRWTATSEWSGFDGLYR